MNTEYTPKFKNAQVAFQNAIEHGLLSVDSSKENYAGRFMYMHSDDERDYFKHIDRRYYIDCETQPLNEVRS